MWQELDEVHSNHDEYVKGCVLCDMEAEPDGDA